MREVMILGISGSPRKNANTYYFVEKALERAGSVAGVTTSMYQCAGKKFNHCISCYKCLETGRCVFNDHLDEFMALYMKADGIIWGVPVYHMSVPSQAKALLDRLGNVLLMYYLRKGQDIPRLSKACGILTVGAHRNGGQDMVLNYMTASCLMLNSIVVSGQSLAGSYIGASGWSGKGDNPLGLDNIKNDEEGIRCGESVGQRVAEMAKIISAGKEALKDELPDEYTVSWENNNENP